jgi:hypothetical protein
MSYQHLTEKEIDFLNIYKETFRIGLVPFQSIVSSDNNNIVTKLLYFNEKDFFIGKRVACGSFDIFKNPLQNNNLFRKYVVVLLSEIKDHHFYDQDVYFSSTLMLKGKSNTDSPDFDGIKTEKISDFLLKVICHCLNFQNVHIDSINDDKFIKFLNYYELSFDSGFMFHRLFDSVAVINIEENKA